MKLFEAALDDCYEDLSPSMEIFESEIVRKYIVELSSNSSKILTIRQVSYGENALNHFLRSNDPNYSLDCGKSELILALSLYCSMLPENARTERHNLIVEKICSEKAVLLSETVYNDLKNGRAGILLALTHFYLLQADDRIKDIISSLLLLMISDARFYKKSVTWFRSDPIQDGWGFFYANSDILFALNYVNSVFRNEFLDILLESILVDASRLRRYKSGNIQQPGGIRDAKRTPNSSDAEQDGYSSELLAWFSTLKRLTDSSFSEETASDFNLNNLTIYEGFSTLISNNFFEFVKEISSQLLDEIISELTRSCKDLDQYQILKVVKAIRVEEEKYKFRVMLRRLRLRVEMIDRSGILIKQSAVDSTFYLNCRRFAEMSTCDFFNVNLTINQRDVFHRLINSNWLYSYNYERKNLIGCFSINRYDKSIFVNTDLLDGFLPRLFLYLSGRGGCVSQFKRDVLDNLKLEINEEHLKNRLLLLIRQGILIPTENSAIANN